jgi:hypothetical protein
VESVQTKTIPFFHFSFGTLLKIMASRDDDKQSIPELIYDVGANVTYRKG